MPSKLESELLQMTAAERRELLNKLARVDKEAMALELRSVRPRFGAWLRTTREAAGISQAGLADAVRLSRPAVASIEAGRQSCAVEFLVVASRALNADPLDALRFCLGNDPLPTPKPPRRGRPRIGERQ